MGEIGGASKEVFIPDYTVKRRRSSVARPGYSRTNGPVFDKTQLTKLLISSLKELGYADSAAALQKESGGVQVESEEVQKLFEMIHNGQYSDITVYLLSQLPLRCGRLPDSMLDDATTDSKQADIIGCMQREFGNLRDLAEKLHLSKFSASSPQLLQLTEIMILINKEIFLEMLYHENDLSTAVLFLRNCLRKFIQLWDSLLSFENDFLNPNQRAEALMSFTPANLLKHMTVLLTSPQKDRTFWPGSVAASRQLLIEQLSTFIDPDHLVPKGRLLTLLQQAIKYQSSKDVLAFNSDDDDDDDDEEGVHKPRGAVSKVDLLQDATSGFHKIKFMEEKTLGQNVDEIWFLEFSPNGKYLASASADSLTDRKILIYDMEQNFQVYKVLAGNDQCVLYLSFSPDSRYIVSCPFNEAVNIYDIHSEGVPTDINGDSTFVAEVIQPIDSFQIPMITNDPTVINHHGDMSELGDNSPTSSIPNHSGNTPRTWCCDWFHTEIHKGKIAVGSPDREVVIYDTKTKSIVYRLSLSPVSTQELIPRVHDLKITADDQNLILMTPLGNIDVYDLSHLPADFSGADNPRIPRIGTFAVPNKATCLSLPNINFKRSGSDVPLNSLLLISLQSNEIQLWDFKEQILIQKFFGQRQEQFIIRSCFGYNNCLVASGSEDGKIYIWNRFNGNIVGVLTGHVAERQIVKPRGPTVTNSSSSGRTLEKNCNMVVWNPMDKTIFASGGDDGLIKIWRVIRE